MYLVGGHVVADQDPRDLLVHQLVRRESGPLVVRSRLRRDAVFKLAPIMERPDLCPPKM